MTLDELLQPYRDEMMRSAERPPMAAPGLPPQGYVPDYVAGGEGSWLTSWSLAEREKQLRFLGDAMRANNNLFTSMVDWVTMTSRMSAFPDDPTFNVFRDYDLKGLESYAYQFAGARSREQADVIKDFMVRDMAARKSFSEQGEWTQFLLGTAAAIGPADFLPFVALPKSVVGAGMVMGGALGLQAGVRHSLGSSPGSIEDVGLDAAFGMMFGTGYRALERSLSRHGIEFERWKAAANESDAASVSGAPEVRPSPIVTPDAEPQIRTPAAAAHDAPFVVSEPGPTSGPMVDHRVQPIHDPEAAPGRPVIVYEPVYLREGEIVDLPHAPRIIEEVGPSGQPDVTAGIYARPWIITETDAAGSGVARAAPSTHEIVTGQMSPEPLSARGVKLSEAAPEPPAAAKSADEPPEGYRRPVVIEDSGVGSASAVPTPTDEASRLVSAGGLERLGLTPAMRLLNSALASMRETAGALVNHGMLQLGNLSGVAIDQSVEARYFALHGARITQTVHGFWEDFAAYAGRTTSTGSRTVDFMVNRLRSGGPTYRGFMEEVSRAVLAGGHENPAVVSAAKRFHAATEDLRARANEVGYWDFLYGMREEELTQRIAASGRAPERKARLEKELEDLRAEREQAQQRGGPVASQDEGYLPRYWRHDRIMADRERVEAIFDQVIKAKGIRDPMTGKPYTGKEAVDILLNIDPATGAPRPYTKPGAETLAHSARDRGFSWMPTHLLLDYVELDAEVLFRRYVRQLGMDIELTERFGDPFMMNHIRRLAGEGASHAELNDLMFLRDYLRGTHAPMDPTSILTHSTQAAKYLANMVVLGGQTITAFTDLARPMMTEGIRRAFGTSLEALGDGLAGLKMWRREADLLGSTGELVQSLRAQAFANGNSAMAGTPRWLQALERAHSGFFIANGIAPWTETMKTWQSIITTTRVMEDLEALVGGKPLPEKARTKLAAIGIDARNAGAIAEQLEKHAVWLNKTRLPNIGAWDNLEAARTFRTAVWQAVNNSIVTPGASNVPRWAVEGTSWLPPQAAQLLSMYHNYGLALHQRLLTAGLQGADANFVAGAMSLVALGYTVDRIRDDLNTVGDRKPRQKSFGKELTDAVDRSGLLGYASNINNAIERLSMNTLGVRPFTGQVTLGSGSVVGALGGLGPVGGWAGNLYRFVNGTAHGREGWAEAQAFRRMLPLQNLFWMDGLFDRLQETVYVSQDERRARARVAKESARAAESHR